MACDDTKPDNETAQPLFLHQGADFVQTFTYTTSDEVTPIDITGYTFSMVLAEKKAGGTIVKTWTTADGDFSIVTAASGIYKISIPASETTSMTPGTYWFDHNATVSSQIIPMAQGIIIVDEAA
jgi:hypothetical protein